MFLIINWNSIDWTIVSTISSSFFSFIAIIISAIAVIKTSKDNNKMLEATSRAYVSIYTEALISNRQYFYLVFRNFGKTNAFITNIEIDTKTREMISTRGIDRFHYLTNSNLAPGQSFTHAILTDSNEYDHNHISKFEITYKSGRKEYSEKFEFKLSDHTRMPSIGISNGDFKKQFLELYQDEIRKKL